MISEAFTGDVYIADFTDYASKPDAEPVDYSGVVVLSQDNGVIPSFILHDYSKTRKHDYSKTSRKIICYLQTINIIRQFICRGLY